MNRRLAARAAALALTFAARTPAQEVPVHTPLRRAQSEHFTYVYESSLQPRVAALAGLCEDAHALLCPVFHWEPRCRTTILYVDSADIHNGWASVYPRPTILLLASDALSGSTIYEPGDYLRRTVFHEYTHVLLSDAQYGADAAIASVFGRVISAGDLLSALIMLGAAPPGMLAPAWYQEGFAIWAETEFGGRGRGRNSVVDMILRMAVAGDRFLDGSQWSLDHPEWPYGEAAYLYGMTLAEQLHERSLTSSPPRNVTGEVADEVSHSFGFGFNRCSVPAARAPFKRVVDDAIRTQTGRQRNRIAALEAQPLTPLPRLTPERIVVSSPVFGPGGRSVYFAGLEEERRSTLYRFDRDTGRTRKLDGARTTWSPASTLTASPDREGIYYTRLDVHGRDRTRYELYRLDPRTDRVRRVTARGRYRYPAISPDGRRMAAVVNGAGVPSLIEVPLATAADADAGDRRLLTAPPLHVLADPVYTPGGEAILVVQAGESSSRLLRVDAASGECRTLVEWPCTILSPACHPTDGTVCFVSDRNGVFNLYRVPLAGDAPPVALTHALGGVFEPDISPDGRQVAATGYDARGYYLTVLDYDALRPLAFELPALASAWRTLPLNADAVKRRTEAPPLPEPRWQPYRSLSETRFDYWSPWLEASGADWAGGLFTALSDPTRFQSLQLMGGAEDRYDTWLGSAVYRYAGIYPILTVYGTRLPVLYSDLVEANGLWFDYAEAATTAGAAVTVPWPRADHTLALSLGCAWTRREEVDRGFNLHDELPAMEGLFEGTEAGLWGRLEWMSADAYARSSSPEDGRRVALSGDWTGGALGGDLSRRRFRADWSEYVRLPWGDNQVLKLDAVFGRGEGDSTRQGDFGLGDFSVPGSAPGFERSVPLRGYGPNCQVGRDIVKAGAAYRFPLCRVYRNAGPTTPLYFHQFFGEVFYEGGRATGGEPPGRETPWLDSAGAEINLSMTVLRFAGIAPGAGIAYAFDREPRRGADGSEETGGKLQYYLSVKGIVNF